MKITIIKLLALNPDIIDFTVSSSTTTIKTKFKIINSRIGNEDINKKYKNAFNFEIPWFLYLLLEYRKEIRGQANRDTIKINIKIWPIKIRNIKE